MHRLGRRPLADQPVCPVHGDMVLVAERRTGELDRWDRSALLRLRLRVFDRPARPYTETLCIFSKQKVSDLSIIPSKIEAYEASQLLSAKASLKSKSIPQGKPVSRWDLRAKKNAGVAAGAVFLSMKRRLTTPSGRGSRWRLPAGCVGGTVSPDAGGRPGRSDPSRSRSRTRTHPDQGS